MSGVSIYSPYNNISAKEKLLLSEGTAYSLAKCLQKTSMEGHKTERELGKRQQSAEEQVKKLVEKLKTCYLLMKMQKQQVLLLAETINDGRDICSKIFKYLHMIWNDQSLTESQDQASRPNMEKIQRLMEQLLIKLCPDITNDIPYSVEGLMPALSSCEAEREMGERQQRPEWTSHGVLLFYEKLYQNLYYTLQFPSLEEELRATLAHSKQMVELEIQRLCGEILYEKERDERQAPTILRNKYYCEEMGVLYSELKRDTEVPTGNISTSEKRDEGKVDARLAVSWTEEKSEDDTNNSFDEKHLITSANSEDSLSYNPPDSKTEAHYVWPHYLAEIPEDGNISTSDMRDKGKVDARLVVSWTEEKSEDDTKDSFDEKDLITSANYEDSLSYNPPDYKTEAHYEWPCYLAEIPQDGNISTSEKRDEGKMDARLAVSWTEEKSEDDTKDSFDEKDLITSAYYDDSLSYNPPDYKTEAHYEWPCYLAEIPQDGNISTSEKRDEVKIDARLPESCTEEKYNDGTDVSLDEKYFIPFEHFEDSFPYNPPGYKSETQYVCTCYFSEIPQRGNISTSEKRDEGKVDARLPESCTEEKYNDETDVSLDEKYFMLSEHFDDSLPYNPPGYITEAQYERPCYFREIPRREVSLQLSVSTLNAIQYEDWFSRNSLRQIGEEPFGSLSIKEQIMARKMLYPNWRLACRFPGHQT